MLRHHSKNHSRCSPPAAEMSAPLRRAAHAAASSSARLHAARLFASAAPPPHDAFLRLPSHSSPPLSRATAAPVAPVNYSFCKVRPASHRAAPRREDAPGAERGHNYPHRGALAPRGASPLLFRGNFFSLPASAPAPEAPPGSPFAPPPRAPAPAPPTASRRGIELTPHPPPPPTTACPLPRVPARPPARGAAGAPARTSTRPRETGPRRARLCHLPRPRPAPPPRAAGLQRAGHELRPARQAPPLRAGARQHQREVRRARASPATRASRSHLRPDQSLEVEGRVPQRRANKGARPRVAPPWCGSMGVACHMKACSLGPGAVGGAKAKGGVAGQTRVEAAVRSCYCTCESVEMSRLGGALCLGAVRRAPPDTRTTPPVLSPPSSRSSSKPACSAR